MRVGEVWRDVVGYEGFYEISNYGRVKSLRLKRNNGIMKYCIDRYGYKVVRLTVNSEVQSYTIHRLVAIAFIPNPNDDPCINHINEDKLDNHVNNLEWCTVKYNSNYGTINHRRSQWVSKPVLQYNLHGEIIGRYNSITEVNRKFQYDISYISKCCRGVKDVAYGYIWEFEENEVIYNE